MSSRVVETKSFVMGPEFMGVMLSSAISTGADVTKVATAFVILMKKLLLVRSVSSAITKVELGRESFMADMGSVCIFSPEFMGTMLGSALNAGVVDTSKIAIVFAILMQKLSSDYSTVQISSSRSKFFTEQPPDIFPVLKYSEMLVVPVGPKIRFVDFDHTYNGERLTDSPLTKKELSEIKSMKNFYKV